MFTWRIGQAQTIEGASIISTNTDGLYSVLEAEENNKILAREAASIHVDIEPEPIFLISKDTNNRAEIEVKDGQLAEVASASGGTLGCREGPTPTKSLAHPAIIDWALTEYLILASVNYKGTSMDNEFVDEIGRSIIMSAREKFNDDLHTLVMFQDVVASSPSSQRFIFASSENSDGSEIILPLQHYNRCFIVKDKTPGTYHLKAAVARVITEATQTKRKKAHERAQQHDRTAVDILTINGVKVNELPLDKEASVVKISGLEDSWYIRVDNRDLHYLTQDEINDILDNIDYDKYLELLRDSFNKNWRNVTPDALIAAEEAKQAAKNAKPASLFDNMTTDDNVQTAVLTDAQVTSADTAIAQPITSASVVSEETESSIQTTLPDASDFMSGIDLPKMIQLNKTLLDTTDIKNGEHVLCMSGIREISAHDVLSKLLSVMTNTDINA